MKYAELSDIFLEILEELLKELECFEDNSKQLETHSPIIEFPEVPDNEIIVNSLSEKEALSI